jgi:hypothetical protein
VQALARTTVLCAVWHKDVKRRQLLAGHAANLDRQTRPTKRIYVFDGDDVPPPDLAGLALTSREPLTSFQAFNLGLSLIDTPFVMTLNLDDRLAPDAIAVLEDALDTGSDLAAGDWKVCYSQEETDAVTACYLASALPFVPDWPPPAGAVTRLGSGTGSRGTYGPAFLWRMALHMEFPRLPCRFGDGSLIRSIADAIWWRLLLQKNKRLERVPSVIGNYYSHPADQAEFRNPVGDEEAILARVGVHLL